MRFSFFYLNYIIDSLSLLKLSSFHRIVTQITIKLHTKEWILFVFITVCKRSCGKVMSLHLSVSHFVHGEGYIPVCNGSGCTPSPWTLTHSGHPLEPHPIHTSLDTHPWAVRVLLECILVHLSMLSNLVLFAGKLY